jgi:peptide subunit release factor RF-3
MEIERQRGISCLFVLAFNHKEKKINIIPLGTKDFAGRYI